MSTTRALWGVVALLMGLLAISVVVNTQLARFVLIAVLALVFAGTVSWNVSARRMEEEQAPDELRNETFLLMYHSSFLSIGRLAGTMAGLAFAATVLIYQAVDSLPMGEWILSWSAVSSFLLALSAIAYGRCAGLLRTRQYGLVKRIGVLANHMFQWSTFS